MGRGFVLWLTGLSGTGKTTLARRLAGELGALGYHVEVLDGDEVRANLSRGLGFSKEDRDTNIRRIGYVAAMVARAGAVAVVAAISPYRAVREEVRAAAPRFVEVWCRCPLEVLVRRDPKGLYARALRGELSGFTGIDDPYEEPLVPEVTVDSSAESVEESVERVLRRLAREGLVRRPAPERLPGGEHLATLRARARLLPAIEVGRRELADAYLLAAGALAPLLGFMGECDYLSVLERGRLASDDPFTIPVVLRVDEAGAALARRHREVTLSLGGRPVALLEPEEVYRTDLRREALAVFGTLDAAHPGVRLLLSAGSWAVAGEVIALERPASGFPERDLTPARVRELKAERGWRTMVGFQTRNPIHRAHEYLQKVALELVDGLLLHPLVGETKEDDLEAGLRMRCYEELLRHYYPSERVLLATNPSWMRYAGPREAVFHAILRRNYGCTHFIVGRDHAGVGSYYDSYAAHRIFDQYGPGELGIEVLRFEHAFFCRTCGGMASTRTCPHPTEQRVALSGTRVRELLGGGRPLPPEFTRPEVARILAGTEFTV
jgi:3'-phosphoadenosine 5'-phosphosulfate synthase